MGGADMTRSLANNGGCAFHFIEKREGVNDEKNYDSQRFGINARIKR